MYANAIAIGTPSALRKSCAVSDFARGDINCCARKPLVFAGESRKTDRGIVLEPNAISAAYLSAAGRPSRDLPLSYSVSGCRPDAGRTRIDIEERNPPTPGW